MDLTFTFLAAAFPAAALILVLIVNWRRKGVKSGQATKAEPAEVRDTTTSQTSDAGLAQGDGPASRHASADDKSQ